MQSILTTRVWVKKQFLGDGDADESHDPHFIVLIGSSTSFRAFTYIKINYNLTSKIFMPATIGHGYWERQIN